MQDLPSLFASKCHALLSQKYEKARFYRMAKRSATECAGILDVCQRLQIVDEERYAKGRELLISIVSMLVKMAQKQR